MRERGKPALAVGAVVAVLVAGAMAAQGAFSLPRADAPTVKIKATLFPGEAGFTIYKANFERGEPKDVAPTYEWTLKPAAGDPGCSEFKRGIETAQWLHGNKNSSCAHHASSGHSGTVTVVVTQGPWTCTASYEGTQSGAKDGTCRAGTTGGKKKPVTPAPDVSVEFKNDYATVPYDPKAKRGRQIPFNFVNVTVVNDGPTRVTGAYVTLAVLDGGGTPFEGRLDFVSQAPGWRCEPRAGTIGHRITCTKPVIDRGKDELPAIRFSIQDDFPATRGGLKTMIAKGLSFQASVRVDQKERSTTNNRAKASMTFVAK